ncbi:protein of unknown function [Nitrospira japonica]|uniref:Uncharacterized protein n=1 Tax=Nitrospira japonica TaxID=1325564 RepID=A0A1W1I365_9BACT|nr:protein of unknown function [Nitrospira japonica]
MDTSPEALTGRSTLSACGGRSEWIIGADSLRDIRECRTGCWYHLYLNSGSAHPRQGLTGGER